MATGVEQRFGRYGGRYVPRRLMPALAQLEQAVGGGACRPRLPRSVWTRCWRATGAGPRRSTTRSACPSARGTRIPEARGPAPHGAHKINNAIGQALLAQRMGKPRVIAETGAGQHGVATATACALLGLEYVVFMGTEDMRRQRPNVERMELLGATVEPVETVRAP